MNNEGIIAEVERYEIELICILKRFVRTTRSWSIQHDDHSKLRQFVPEMIDLFNDALGPNSYSQQIGQEYNVGVANLHPSPSYRSIDNMAAVLRAALTRFKRNPAILDNKKARIALFIEKMSSLSMVGMKQNGEN